MGESKPLKVDYPGEFANDSPGNGNQMKMEDMGVAKNPVEPALGTLQKDLETQEE